jgi:hypothetical protein
VTAFFHKQGGGFKPGTDVEVDGRVYHGFPEVHANLPGRMGGVRKAALVSA